MREFWIVIDWESFSDEWNVVSIILVRECEWFK